nr:uncharacterized protein LOC111851265 [Paramormyrops kingsleyae]
MIVMITALMMMLLMMMMMFPFRTTFRREKGGQQAEDCSVCPAGYFCPHASTIRPSPCGAGSYSADGSAVCLPCQRGHYCSNDATSQEAMLSQMVCPAGLLCSQGLDREPQRSSTLCPKGFYCPGGSVDPNPIPCPNGTYGSQAGLRKLEECTTCPAGHFCFSLQPLGHPLTEPVSSPVTSTLNMTWIISRYNNLPSWRFG